MKRFQAYLAGGLALFGVLVLGGVVYLICITPKIVATWEAENKGALTVAERTFLNLSSLCRDFGLFLIPLLLLFIIGCGIWSVLAGVSSKQDTANS